MDSCCLHPTLLRRSRKYLRVIDVLCYTHILYSQILQTIAGVHGRGIGYIYSGRVIAGIGVGAISAVAPAYVSECSPKNVRGRITGLFQIMVAIGVMLSYWINCEWTYLLERGENSS